MVKWSFELKRWDNLEKHTQFDKMYSCTLISLLLLRHKYVLILKRIDLRMTFIKSYSYVKYGKQI